jgi:hypothetical protein
MKLGEVWKKKLILETKSGYLLVPVKTARKLEMKAWIPVVGIGLE